MSLAGHSSLTTESASTTELRGRSTSLAHARGHAATLTPSKPNLKGDSVEPVSWAYKVFGLLAAITGCLCACGVVAGYRRRQQKRAHEAVAQGKMVSKWRANKVTEEAPQVAIV